MKLMIFFYLTSLHPLSFFPCFTGYFSEFLCKFRCQTSSYSDFIIHKRSLFDRRDDWLIFLVFWGYIDLIGVFNRDQNYLFLILSLLIFYIFNFNKFLFICFSLTFVFSRFCFLFRSNLGIRLFNLILQSSCFLLYFWCIVWFIIWVMCDCCRFAFLLVDMVIECNQGVSEKWMHNCHQAGMLYIIRESNPFYAFRNLFRSFLWWAGS